MKKLTLLATMILAVVALTAQIIHVPADHPTIQEGIDAASDGDTVLVAEGTYFENINFKGKAITVASHFIDDADTMRISNTIINGSLPKEKGFGSVVTFDTGEDTTSILCGFTITGGTGTFILGGGWDLKAGGGILLDGAGGKITNNYIKYNELDYDQYVTGGGISAGGPTEPQPWLILTENKVSHNKAISASSEANGGGLEAYCNLIMKNNEIAYNEANGAYQSLGAGVSIWGAFGHIEAFVHNNLIANNKLISNTGITNFAQGSGISIREDCAGIISGNIIANNSIEVPFDKNCYGPGLMTWKAIEELIVENNLIIGNTFTGGSCVGGGLNVWWGAGKYQNNVIQNNNATHGGGIALAYDQLDVIPSFMNNTVTDNEGIDFGSGLYIFSADAVVINSIIWGNYPYSIESIYEEEADLEVRYSNIAGEEEWPGQGNMNVEPEFGVDGYHLDVWSPMLNEGKESVLINGEWYDAPEYDIDGDERPYENTFPDIGADEAMWCCVDIPETADNEKVSLSVSPNPFSSTAKIRFDLRSNSDVELIVFNQLGEVVELINRAALPKGKHQIDWNAENQPAGIYYCVLKIQNQTSTVKIIRF